MPNWLSSLKNGFSNSQQGCPCSTQDATYRSLDLLFRKEVKALALESLSQEKQQILHLDSSFLCATKKNLEKENKQYKVWASSILSTLQKLKEEKISLKEVKVFQWKNSVGAVVQSLRLESGVLLEENKKKKERIQELLFQLEGIKIENAEIIYAMIQTLLTDAQVTESLASKEPDISNTEEDNSKLMRRISNESGYCSSEEEDVLPDSIIRLKEKNNNYKIWIAAVKNRFKEHSDTHTLFDLQACSWEKADLIEKNKKKDERMQLLQEQLAQEKIDNLDLRKNNRALQDASLWKEIRNKQFLRLLGFSEKIVDKQKTELRSIQDDLENLQKKMAEWDQNAMQLTTCLQQTKELSTLLAERYSFDI